MECFFLSIWIEFEFTWTKREVHQTPCSDTRHLSITLRCSLTVCQCGSRCEQIHTIVSRPCFFLFIRPNWAKWAQVSKKQPRIFPRGLNSEADVTTSSQVLHCHRHHSYSGAIFDLSHPPTVYSHQMFKNKIRQVENETESMKSATNYIWPTF